MVNGLGEVLGGEMGVPAGGGDWIAVPPPPTLAVLIVTAAALVDGKGAPVPDGDGRAEALLAAVG